MKRCSLLVGAVTLMCPVVASAGEPCESEAAAIRGSQPDASLTKPTDPDAIVHMKAANGHSLTGSKLAAVVATQSQAAPEFKAAVEEYIAAWMISPTPSILYNLAQTYRAAGDYTNAIEQYRRFLARGKPGRLLRGLVECHIAAMTDELNHAASTAPPEGPVTGDEPSPPTHAPVPTDTSAAPPRDGIPSVDRGEVATAPPWHADTFGWGVTGAGAVVVGVGGYLILDARSLRADALDEPRDDVRIEMRATADRRQRWGTVTLAAGAAILAVGVVRLALTPDAPRARSGLSVTVAPGGLALAGSF